MYLQLSSLLWQFLSRLMSLSSFDLPFIAVSIKAVVVTCQNKPLLEGFYQLILILNIF